VAVAQAERLFAESARVVATGWSDVEMYGADCLKQSHHRFAVAVKNLEQALKLEGDTVHPLIYKELSRAYAALALYHYDIRPKRDLAQTYALHSTRAGKEAIARYDKSVGWTASVAAGFTLRWQSPASVVETRPRPTTTWPWPDDSVK